MENKHKNKKYFNLALFIFILVGLISLIWNFPVLFGTIMGGSFAVFVMVCIIYGVLQLKKQLDDERRMLYASIIGPIIYWLLLIFSGWFATSRINLKDDLLAIVYCITGGVASFFILRLKKKEISILSKR